MAQPKLSAGDLGVTRAVAPVMADALALAVDEGLSETSPFVALWKDVRVYLYAVRQWTRMPEYLWLLVAGVFYAAGVAQGRKEAVQK